MAGYADVEDPIVLLNRAPDTSGGPAVEDAIREAGFEVQAVNWVWERVVGENLVESIIEPITGDFEKIAEQAGHWENICDALQAIRNNLNAGLGELRPAWQGTAASQFQNLISTTWTVGIEADAQAAKLIGFVLKKVAEGSKRACDQVLDLIKTLVDKLIEAAAMLPIPVVGWGRAVKLVYDGIQIYNAIMSLIEGIRSIIDGAQQVIQGIQQIGTALSKIDDISNLNDALNVANETGEGIATTASGVNSVRGGVTEAAGAAGDLRDSASSARDNASGLHDERSAARDQSTSGTDTSSGGNGSAADTQSSASRPAGRGDSDSMAANAGDENTAGRPVECLPGSGDPVDLATGQMFMSGKDLDLSGVLPLVVERTYLSSYRVGRFFGRSWSSTLDQRIEVGDDAVYFAAADGARLRFPVPEADGQPVFPATGSRWALVRAETGYTITQTKLGHTLHFPAGAGRQQIAALTDRNGNRVDFTYDAEGAPTELRHSCGHQVGFDTDGGLVTRIWLHNPDGAPITVMRYAYDELGQLVQVLNSSGRPMRFEYDHAGRVTQWTDRNGEWYRYHYDADGRVTSSEGAGNALVGTWTYDDDNRRRTFTDALDHPTRYGFNDRWQLVTVTDPLGHTTTQEWNSYNQLTARTDQLGRTTRYTYDESGNLTTITRPDGKQTVVEFGFLGLPVRITKPGNEIWLNEYDERGNLVSVTDPGASQTRFAYNARGALLSVTDALGGVRRVEPNTAGLPVAVTDATGATTRYRRDIMGRVSSIRDPAGGQVRMTWTIEGRLLSRTLPDGSTERWSYDSEGSQIEHVDVLGQASHTTYGHFDLPVTQTGPDGAALKFAYDSALRLVSVTNPQGLAWRYDYDAAGNLVSETDFNGRTLRYGYDAAGWLIARTNGVGETTTFTRDEVGRVVEKRAGAAVTTFAYDPAGRMTRATSPDATLEFERDRLGRVLAETCNGRTVRSSFDALGRRVGRLAPSGAESTWAYGAGDRPVSLTAGGHTLRFDYDVVGREVRRRLGAGAVLAQQWDANHRLTTQTLTAPDLHPGAGRPARNVQHRAYHYRPDGNLVGVDDQVAGSRRYDLDRAGRVTALHGRDWTEQYAYDVAGNIVQAGWPATPDTDGTTQAQGPREYTGTLVHRAGNTTYRHDAQGRVVQRQRRTLSGRRQSWTFTWDAEDRLAGVVTPDGAQWRYTYDPLGRRVSKHHVGGLTTTFVWDGATLAEQSVTGGDGPSATTTWDFAPGSFRPLTQTERVSRPGGHTSQEEVDQQFYALITDLVGTPTEMVDPDGELAWHRQTTLWGQELARPDSGPSCPLRFPGQYHDRETGDNYNYHRYYDPTSGQYTATDPLGLGGGLQVQSYVRNPAVWRDPLGLTPSCQSGDNVPSVDTPYGPAVQENSPAALAAREQVEAGAPVYRSGTMGRSQAAEAQFWALEHPTTPGYASRYGIPQENVANADFVEQGRVPPGTPFITRSAPGIGENVGGGIEVVVPSGGVDLDWFSAVGPKGLD